MSEKHDTIQEARERQGEATRLARKAAEDRDPFVAIDRLSTAVERLAQVTNRLILLVEDEQS